MVTLGRRAGKTVLGIDRLAYTALHGKPAAYFAPSYRMLSEVWREAKNLLHPVTSGKLETEHRLDIMTGGSLEFWSLDNPDAGRGRKYARVVIDEAAMVRDLEYAWQNVIRPTLADLAGDAWFLSTPKGLNHFHRLYAQAADTPDWRRWQMPTSVNPYIPPSEVQALKAELPERVYRQEILAEFIEDGSFFQNLDQAATVQQPDQPEQHQGHYLGMGIDFALSSDFSVLTVACRECNRVVDWDRFNQIDYTYQRQRIISMATRWHCNNVLPERNSIGEPNTEILSASLPIGYGPDGKPGWNTTATTKPTLIQGLAAALEHGKFLVPADYADELRSYQVETMASGHPQFSAPAGQHDDRVISLALAWQAITSTPMILFGA